MCFGNGGGPTQIFSRWATRSRHTPKAEDIQTTVIDHDENRQILLRDHHDIDSEFAYKGTGSVLDRVFLINTALRRAQEGKDGGLYIYDGLVCNSDPNPDIQDDPGSLIEEMEKLQFSETQDAPIKEFDDAADALGYFFPMAVKADRDRLRNPNRQAD